MRIWHEVLCFKCSGLEKFKTKSHLQRSNRCKQMFSSFNIIKTSCDDAKCTWKTKPDLPALSFFYWKKSESYCAHQPKHSYFVCLRSYPWEKHSIKNLLLLSPLQLFGDVCFHCNRVIEGDGKHYPKCFLNVPFWWEFSSEVELMGKQPP